VSGVVVDAATGKPIEGVSVEVSWSGLREKHFFSFESEHEVKKIHVATAVTDTNGFFRIPAWGPVAVAREWRYYDWDPEVSYSKPGYVKPTFKENHNNQRWVTPFALPFGIVNLGRPSWNNQRLPLALSDGKGDWPLWMQTDASVTHNPYLIANDAELG
jgi:hypothetical protein